MSLCGAPRVTLAAAAFLAAAFSSTAGAEDRTGERFLGSRSVLGAQAMARCTSGVASGQTDDAIVAACTDAIEGEPLNRVNLIATRINRGVLHLRRQEAEPALADFDAVIALDARHAEAHVNRGAALAMLGRHGPAVAAITTALSYGVREPHKAYLNRGAAREKLGDLRGAYDDYNTALTIRPDWDPAEAELARFARARREVLARRLDVPPVVSPARSGSE